jgi:hypothetical protein
MIYFYYYLLIPPTQQTFPTIVLSIYYDINQDFIYQKQKNMFKILVQNVKMFQTEFYLTFIYLN